MPIQIPILDMYDYSYIPLWQRGWFIFLSMTSLGAILIFFVWLIIRHIRYKRSMKQKEPWQIALERLNGLSIHHMEAKEFYFNLTDIMKHYLSSHYGYIIASKTDEEVISFINADTVPSDIVSIVHHIFQSPVMIKFANQAAQQEQMADDLQKCKTLIVHTRVKKS